MNIIIPVAGVGKRFQEDGYSAPKPLINVLGEPMIFYVLRSLRVDPSDKIYIVYTQDLDRYSFQDVCRKEFHDLNLNFILLNFHTRGPAETVLCGLNKIADLGDKVLVLDCDTFYGEDILSMAKAEENCIFYFTDSSKEPIFSYIKIDAEGRVSEIKEKSRISSNACTGAYGFKTGILLKKYCELILDSDCRSNNEYYLSGVYDRMLKDGEIVIPCKVSDFHCLGTPQQLKTYCLDNGTGKKRFCFDLDGTLVTFPEEHGNYKSVKPITRNIRLVRYLHEQGHAIIIQTARRMLSSSHNPGQATARAHADVLDTLEKYAIPFDEIYFGKPFANFYIDDLSVKPFDMEKEIGFYDASIDARHFNSMEYYEDHVIKTTNNPGEVYWYGNIPASVKKHFARVLAINGKTLKLERISGIVFSYLLVNNSLTKNNIWSLLDTIHKVHVSSKAPDTGTDYGANYNAKIAQRYKEFDYRSISNEAGNYFEEITRKLAGHTPSIGVIHGDLVFSNIFLCDNQIIRFIDMRGRVGEVETIFGDIFYDYAKIYQSLWGYDFILNDCEINMIYLRELREIFELSFLLEFSAERLEFLKYITAGLLFSLIPLHTDSEKQKKYFELIGEILP